MKFTKSLPAKAIARAKVPINTSLAQKENYELDLNGTVELDWTAEEMAKATDVESLLEEENEQ